VGKYRTAIQDADDNIIRIMYIACFVTKTINTHPQYVPLIANPRPQWLREGLSVLR